MILKIFGSLPLRYLSRRERERERERERKQRDKEDTEREERKAPRQESGKTTRATRIERATVCCRHSNEEEESQENSCNREYI